MKYLSEEDEQYVAEDFQGPPGKLASGSHERVVGRCVEVGDDDEGQPRLIIHTTREQLKRMGRNLAYVDVVVTIAPPNAKL